MVDFKLSPEIREMRTKAKTFLDAKIIPNEEALSRHDAESIALMKDLQAQVKAMGMFAMFIGPEAGGTGKGFLPYAYVNEILGRSPYAPRAFGCAAPDTGNAEILHQFGTAEQKDRFMKPLIAGEIRSCFSMTEPEVSGADPTGLRTRAVRDGDEWVINGHKWFTSGAIGASFAIVMCVSDPDAEQHRRMSQIIVPTDTPGFNIIRPVPVMGETDGAHCEIIYDNVRVPVTNVLGEAGDGFRIAQRRLGPGRIHHCMRWLGQMQRAFEIMCNYALTRQVGGAPLAEKQTVQNWIADSAAEIQACRLLTLDAARKLDEGGEARVEVSLIKFYAARVLNDVIDRAIQVHGARGLTDETPLGTMYAMARGARIYDGPDEVHRMVVARRILKEFRDGGVYTFE